jgi:hypothetical protein
MTKDTPVAPEKWHKDTEIDIECSKLISKATKDHIKEKSAEDRNLKTLRNFLLESDNQQLHEYFRDVRELIVTLREKYLEINNEIKSTLRYQQKLEKCLDDLRKDQTLSATCNKLRQSRPRREIDFGQDKIDLLLSSERNKQSFLKKKLQELLQNTIAQVTELLDSKDQLQAVIEEREKVLSLINISSVNCDFRKQLKKKQAIVVEGKEDYNDSVDQLYCYTEAADESIKFAKHVKSLAKSVRKLIKETIENTKLEQKQIHQRINQTLRQKTLETREMKSKINAQIGENRLSLHKCARALHHAQQSYGFVCGPEMSGDLTSREKCNRTIVQSFERHYPQAVSSHEQNQLSGAKNSLSKSIKTSENNIALLLAAQRKLNEQFLHKKKSEQNEQVVARFRRSKADHRWVMNNEDLASRKKK